MNKLTIGKGLTPHQNMVLGSQTALCKDVRYTEYLFEKGQMINY